jgi:hypothetical protein
LTAVPIQIWRNKADEFNAKSQSQPRAAAASAEAEVKTSAVSCPPAPQKPIEAAAKKRGTPKGKKTGEGDVKLINASYRRMLEPWRYGQAGTSSSRSSSVT